MAKEKLENLIWSFLIRNVNSRGQMFEDSFEPSTLKDTVRQVLQFPSFGLFFFLLGSYLWPNLGFDSPKDKKTKTFPMFYRTKKRTTPLKNLPTPKNPEE